MCFLQMLRKVGVVNKFVEFFGPGCAQLSIADRATIGNMAPEYGATCGFFPVDEKTLLYLTQTGENMLLIVFTNCKFTNQIYVLRSNTEEAGAC